MILEEDVARVRADSDIVQVISEHVALKKVGRRWQGLCPFHAEKTASFSVNAEEGLYYCFGCQARGDVITFVREVEHLDFVEAVERLAAKTGIQLRYDDAVVSRDRQRRTRLTEAVEKAVAFYHQRLLSSPDAARARAYLRSRGYDGEVVRAFHIGWAPDDWDALARHLAVPDDVLTDAGLGFVNRRQRQQDTFRARVMFPIFDESGKAVAFGGRLLEGSDGPKYKNSQETSIYSKRRTLYGLNWSKTDVVQAGEAVLCEGYTDVIAFHQAGIRRAVATCGTAVTDEHLRLLKKFAVRRVVLAYDADAAGQAAAERFYAWEQELGLDLAVAAFPSGTDPTDMARRDPALLEKAVVESQSFLSFRLDRVLAAGDVRSAEGRARTAEAALAVVAEHPNENVRTQYFGRIEERTQIPTQQLVSSIRRAGPKPVVRTISPVERREHGPEIEALRLVIHRPGDVAGRLAEFLFDDYLNLSAFRAVRDSASLHDAIEAADPGTRDLLLRLAVEDADEDADDVVARLVERKVNQGLRHDPPTEGWVVFARDELRDPSTRADAAARLVAWLAEREEEE